MIGSSKNNRENYPRKCFWKQEKETRFKFNPGLSANRPSPGPAQIRIIQFRARYDHWIKEVKTHLYTLSLHLR